MFALSGAIETILTPAIATALFWARGLVLVLVIDLATFAVAVISLLALVRVPPIPRQEEVRKERFARSCLFGIRYLARHPGMLWTILLFMVLNLLENCGLFGLRSAYVLAAPGGGEAALALVNALAGVGALAGSALVSLMRPARSRSKVFLWACLLGCVLNDLPMALGRGAPVWAGAALMGGLLMPLLNANLTAGMRARVPVALQGRVFAARDTLQCWTMPVGMFLGGVLADHVFEPFMASGSPMAAALARLVGQGPGSGIAVLFLITATASIALAAAALCHPVFREMDGDDPAL